MVGFDTGYRRDYTDRELARISVDEKRILLTTDRGLLKRNIIIRGYFVRATSPREQLVEVLRQFDLFGSISPFERCIHCNTLLRPIPKEMLADRLLPETSNITKSSAYVQSAAGFTGKGRTTGACRGSLKPLLRVAYPGMVKARTARLKMSLISVMAITDSELTCLLRNASLPSG